MVCFVGWGTWQDACRIIWPRTAIYLPRHLPHIFLEQLSNRDCTAALVETARGKLLLASLYLDANEPVVQDWLRDLMRYADSKQYPLLLSLDANAKTELYGPITNKRGEDFEEFLLQNHLLLENTGTSATYHAFQHGEPVSSYIDFTLSKCLVPLQNWRVLDDEFNGSDHHSITWSIPLDIPPPPLIRPWLKAKWEIFTEHIRQYEFHIPENFTAYKTDKLLSRWYEVINDALDKACPLRPARLLPDEKDWYNNDHKFLNNRTKRKYKAYRRFPVASKRKAFVKAKRSYHKACQRGKKNSWRLFVESTSNETNMAKLFRIAQRRDRRSINTLRKPDGSLTEPGIETIQTLTNAHFPAAHTGTEPVQYDASHKILTSDLEDSFSTWISPSLVRKSLRLFKPNKAAGPDGLKPLVFKYLPDNAIDVLTLIYKACVALGHTPKLWRDTKVIFLPKPGKEIYDIPKSYRPISLSNFPLKGLERLAVWKMDTDLQARPLHPQQHGFTKGKSTESAISNTANYIEQQLYEGRHCLGVFLDISSAFDSISIDHIRNQLLLHNGDPQLVQWYHSYLSRRHLKVELHGETLDLTTATGFPQGGVCSARFWLIAFDPAIRIINSEGITGNGYADDCGALIGGTHPHNMIDQMQAMLDRLVRWGNSCGLRFNPQKTVSVMFTRATRPFNRLVRMDGQLIPYSDSVVYLGVTMDKELKWHQHIHNKITKAKGLLMKMASITYSYWGPKPKLMRWMFTGIVRPMISYAAMTWGHQIDCPDMENALERLNRAAMNTMVKVPRSTPNKGLEIILDLMPLHLHIQQEGLAAFLRLKRHEHLHWEGVFTNITHSVSHLRFWDYVCRDAGIQDYHTEVDTCSTARPPSKYTLDLNSFTDMANCQQTVECNVYTDGSKLNGKVGAGVFIVRDGVAIVEDKFRLPDSSTVYQAELTAIREAAAILAASVDLTSVKFFVDSQAALRTLQMDTITSILALQTITVLNSISADSITFVWTKAHVGHAGNEKADQLAKAGTTLPHPLAIPAPQASIKASIHKHFISRWNKEWNLCPKGRQTKLYHPVRDHGKSNKLIQWSRLKLGRYIRVVTGHNNLLYHLHNMDSSISPVCRFCLQSNEEFYHLANDCPPLWWERHLISAQDPEHVDNWTIDQIISFAYLPSINQALIKPLFTIDKPDTRPNLNVQESDPDDPAAMNSDLDNSNSDISVMDATSESASSINSNDLIQVDDISE